VRSAISPTSTQTSPILATLVSPSHSAPLPVPRRRHHPLAWARVQTRTQAQAIVIASLTHHLVLSPCMSPQRHLAHLNSDLTHPHHPHFTLTQHTAPSPLAGTITLWLGLMCKHEHKRALCSRLHLHVNAVLCRTPMAHLPSTASLFFGPSIPQTTTNTLSPAPSYSLYMLGSSLIQLHCTSSNLEKSCHAIT
jgi:hypothetical protein